MSCEAGFMPVKSAPAPGDRNGEREKVLLKWKDFKATYRGWEKKDAGELKTGEVKRVSVMCRR